MNIQRALKQVQNRANLEVRQALAQIGRVKKHGLTGYGDGCRCDVCCFEKKLNGFRRAT